MGKFELHTFVRPGSANVLGFMALMRYKDLGPSQPLLLRLEPNNPVDPSAVLISDLMGAPVCYVCREDAPLVAGTISAGVSLLCRASGPLLAGGRRDIYIWEEGLEQPQSETRSMELS